MSNANKEEIMSAMSRVIRDFGRKEANSIGLEAIYNEWDSKKDKLRGILSNHPNWNDKAQAIVYSTDVERPVNHEVFRNKMIDMMKFWWDKNKEVSGKPDIDDSQFNVISVLLDSFGNGCGSISEKSIDYIKDTLNSNGFPELVDEVRSGKKESKILGKIFTAWNLPEYFGKIDNGYGKEVYAYDKLFAAIADSLNPLTVQRHTLLSIHPADYLTMSHGTGWKSCHNIYDGGWQAGTLSYMLDGVSAVLYTVDEKYTGDEFWYEEKINRQMYMIDEGTLIGSRIYPKPDDVELATKFRNTVQEMIAKCEKMDNFWDTYETVSNKAKEYITTYPNALHYHDYDYEQYHAKLSLLRSANHPVLVIGAPSLSVVTGKPITDAGTIIGNFVICAGCGEIIEKKNAIDINGKYYCPNCVKRCSICGEYILVYKGKGFEELDGLIFCEDCAKKHIKTCTCCGERHSDTVLKPINGTRRKLICEKCSSNENRDNPYRTCVRCGKVGDNKYITVISDFNGKRRHVCKTCIENFIGYYSDYDFEGDF
jgi:hypothetical protein